MTRQGAGPGQVLRRLGLVTLLGPPLIAAAVLYGLGALGLRDPGLTVAIVVTALVVVGAATVVAVVGPLARAQRELEDGFRRAVALVEQAPDGVFIADRDGRATDVNDAVCRILGRPRDEVMGLRLVELIPPYDVQRFELVRRSLLEGGSHLGDWSLRRRDESYLPVEVNAKILPDGRWLALVRDVSERRASEVVQRRLQERLHAVISIAPDAIVSFDEKLRIVLFNEGAEAIFGWPRDEVLGRPLELLLPERLHDVHAKHVRTFAAEPTRARRMGERERALVGRRRNGEEFPAAASISKLDLDDGRLYTVVLRDITDERRGLEALTAAHDRLARTLHEKEALLREVHHRVKNNLQVVSSLLNLQAQHAPEPARALLAESQARVRSIALVHEQLHRPSEPGLVDFAIYVRSLVEHIWRSFSVGAPIALELAVEDVRLAIDRAIPAGLVINELVTNALLHAFPAGRAGTLQVAVHPVEGDRLEIVVADDGVGVPAALDPRQHGSLGLDLVYTFAEQLEATVEFERAGGTRFALRFPLGSVTAPI